MQTLRKPSKRHSAFTLMELLIVMAVIVILMGIGMLGSKYVIRRSHRTRHQALLREWAKAMEAYYLDHGEFPYDEYVWTQGGSDVTIPNLFNSYLAPYLDEDFEEPFSSSTQMVYYKYTGFQSDREHRPVKITSARLQITEYLQPNGTDEVYEMVGEPFDDPHWFIHWNIVSTASWDPSSRTWSGSSVYTYPHH